MKDNRSKRDIGYFGERIAREYLEKCGYKIAAQNYTVRGGEIDIVAYNSEDLVFVEVKTRRTQNFGRASEAVDRKKISRLCTAAERFIYENSQNTDFKSLKIRFDVIEVYTQNGTLNHIKCIDIN